MNRILNALGLALLATLLWHAPNAAAAGDAAAGKVLYEQNCLSCHGATGKGDGPVGAAINPKPRDFSIGEFKFDSDANGTPGEDSDLILVITKGAGQYGGSPLMAPWGHLSDADRDNLVAYVRSLKQ